MSIRVDLEQLREETDRFGPVAYFLTVSGDGRPHAVAVTVRWSDDRLETETGRSTRANVGEAPSVSLLWPPYEAGGFSLIVDGDAQVGEGATVIVTPTNGVLHRPAPAPAAGDEHPSDCIRL